MQSLFRRPSGIYVFRISVPVLLRPIFGKREVVATTGTSELTIAKIVAGTQAAQWHQRFFDSRRLMSLLGTFTMDYQEILKLTQGHPMLLGGGHLALPHASTASGISPTDLLRAASSGNLSLFVRSGGIRGYLLPGADLELDDPEMGPAGGYVVPAEAQMPENAVAHIGDGLLQIPAMNLTGVTAALLAGANSVTLVAFEIPNHAGEFFIPNDALIVTRDQLEVVAGEVEMLRRSLSAMIPPDRVVEARAANLVALQGVALKAGERAHETLSTALDHYIANRVRQDVGLESEITRIRNGCALLIELGGNVALSDIKPDKLRNFRDTQLSRVPSSENKIRLMHGTTSMSSSIKKVEGTDWPIMSASERNKRMRWIGAWFRWLHTQKWISENPAAALHGESVQTKAERDQEENSDRDDEARDPFTEEDLAAIFGANWFKTGRGSVTKKDTFRTFIPFYYWLPLLGLYTGGGRINELSQLHLANIQQTASGQWYVNFNRNERGQKLKNRPSKRIVPLHPVLLELGFDKWIAALAAAGYTRVFPELKHDSEKGFGKAATKWFTNYMAGLGIPRDGTKTFHSFRHTFINALPVDIPDRMGRQLTGHTRGKDVHDTRYKKDAEPEVLAPYVNRLAVTLPTIAPFDVEVGLCAVKDALQRKNAGRGATEDIDGSQ